MKKFFSSALFIIQWFRNAILFLSVFPLCAYTVYLQTLTSPQPAHWPWLEAQAPIIYTIALLNGLCSLWFFIEEVKQGRRSWWVAITVIGLLIYTVFLLWLMQLVGDHATVLVGMQMFALTLLAFFGPFFSIMCLQLRSHELNAAKKVVPPEQEQERI